MQCRLGPVASASVTVTVAPRPTVDRLPKASSVLTTGCVPKALPAVAPLGEVVKASTVAVVGLTVNALLLPVVNPEAAALRVYVPTVSSRRPVPVMVPGVLPLVPML